MRRPPLVHAGAYGGRRPLSLCARRLAHVRAVTPPADALEGQDCILPFKGTVREVMFMDNCLTMHPPLRKPPSSANPCFLYSFPIKHSGDFSPFCASNFQETFCVTEMLSFIFLSFDRLLPGIAGNWFVTGQSSSPCSRSLDRGPSPP